MPRKSGPPSLGVQAPGAAKGLAVKDTLREVRFNMKHGARKLVDAVEAATHPVDDGTRGPLALLGEPLRMAVRTTATLLSNVDHAAVDLLAADGAYRSMGVALLRSGLHFPAVHPSAVHPAAVHFSGVHFSGVNLSGVNLSGANLSGVNLPGVQLPGVQPSGQPFSGVQLPDAPFSGAHSSRRPRPESLHAFATDHLWRYRHWLSLRRRTEAFVHEHAVAMAGAQVSRELPGAVDVGAARDPEIDPDRRLAASIVVALQQQPVLSAPALVADGQDADLAALSALGAVVVVLAGELAASLDAPTLPDRYREALRSADEIAVADRGGWETALRSLAPTDALARWFAFVVRHF